MRARVWLCTLALSTLCACGVPIIEGSPPSAEDSDTGPSTSSSDAESGESGAGSSEATTDSMDETDESGDETETETEPECTEDGDCPDGVCLDEACVWVNSCLELDELDVDEVLVSGVYPLDPDGPGGEPSYAAYCELELMGGGWTLVLKSSGESKTFDWSSPRWTNVATYQSEFPDLDHSEAKLPSYTRVPLTELLVGFEVPIGVDPDDPKMNWIRLPVAGASLHALIAPGAYTPTQLGREAWKDTIAGSSLQSFCNREGLNVSGDNPAGVRVRVGIIANEYNDCEYTDSRIGVGGHGGDYTELCGTQDLPTGNFAGCSADNGTVNLPAFAWILVR